MPFTPHFLAQGAYLRVVLHAESALAYALEVGSLRFFQAASAFFLLHKTVAKSISLAFCHRTTVFELLLFHLGSFLINRVFFYRHIERGCQRLTGKMGGVVEVDFRTAYRDWQRQGERVMARYTDGRHGNIFSIGLVLHQVHCRGRSPVLCGMWGAEYRDLV